MRDEQHILTAVGLYAGCGGLDLGFKNAGYKILFATDINRYACATYRLHSPDTKVFQGNITKLAADDIPDSDVLLGGPPCQGFSLAGKRDLNDPRNMLYKHYVRLVDFKKPKVFIMENVKGIMTMGRGTVIRQIISDFADCGYDVFYQLLNAKDYGVPQDRERVIFTGFRKDLGVKDFKIPDYTGPKVTIGDALKGFPEPSEDEVYQAGYSPWFTMRNRRREFTDVSQTILATARQIPIYPGSPPMVKLGKDKWVFGEGGVTRRFSYKEAAALQTFPRDMEFCGNLTNKYKQIGNAVPVKLAEWVALAVQSVLLELAGGCLY